MKGKKVLSTVVASALAATTMAMPVMAEGGNLDVDVTVESGVVRVEVPTTLKVAIDQFETLGGSQIYSDPFTIVNRSEMDVKVDVTSKATLGTGVKLLSSVDAVTASKGTEAWLAAATQTAAGSYDDSTTSGTTETVGTLTEANKNVTTFESNGVANQTFYLAKGDKSTTTYTSLVPSEDGKADVSYAKFYELESIQTQPIDADELEAEAADKDVYAIVTADAGKSKQTVTKIAKGTAATSTGFAGTNTYYTMADTETAIKDLVTTKVYAYAATAAQTGGSAAFTYVGKLSSAKEKWAQADISKVSIAYDIVGVPASDYATVKTDCTYGFYRSKAPSIPTKSYTSAAGKDVVISVDLGEAPKDATGIESVSYIGGSGAVKTVEAANYEFNAGKLTLKGAINTATRTYTITFNDTAKTAVDVKVTVK